MITIGVIPVRYDSSRFRGKALFEIAGKTVIQHVYERACRCDMLDRVIVATDDNRIARHVMELGAECFISQKKHSCGTERVAEAVRRKKADIIINIQGDEVLLRPEVIEAAVSALVSSDDISCGTACHKIESADDFVNEDFVMVVLDKQGCALYFSRSPIPHIPSSNKSPAPRLGHIGVYAFKKDALLRFARMKPGILERTESLEQLRLLEAGMKIKVNLTKFNNCSLNRKHDVPIIKKFLAAERE
jgi:3-deoxy-manno-octulosonate cytidylyltransferase (CMP-KDO synthetase)